jgi:hypothetical protein
VARGERSLRDIDAHAAPGTSDKPDLPVGHDVENTRASPAPVFRNVP